MSYEKTVPPLISKLVPVMNAASSDARNATRSATSPAVPSLLNAVAPATFCRTSFAVNISWNFVSINPGQTALTRIPAGPSSLASPLVNVDTAPLEAA